MDALDAVKSKIQKLKYDFATYNSMKRLYENQGRFGEALRYEAAADKLLPLIAFCEEFEKELMKEGEQK